MHWVRLDSATTVPAKVPEAGQSKNLRLHWDLVCKQSGVYSAGEPVGRAVEIFAIWDHFGPRFRPARLRTTVSGYAVFSVMLTRTMCTWYRFRICKFWGVCQEANTTCICKQVVVCMYFLNSQWKRVSGVLLCTSSKRLQKTCLLFGINFWHNDR